MVDLVNVIKAAQAVNFAKLLTSAITEAKSAKDEEWADRLEKAVTRAEVAKDEELEMFDRFKETSHNNLIQDLEEDHEQELQDIREKHAETLHALTTKHHEQRSELTRKHGLEARRLELRRAQGVKEIAKLKEELSEMEAEKKATEKNLLHMTGQRDALSDALVTMKGQFPPQDLTTLEPSQSNQTHHNRYKEMGDTTRITENHLSPAINAAEDMINGTKFSLTSYGPFQPHHQGLLSHAPATPHDPSAYPRLLEIENVQLRKDLEQRHEDVRYAIKKADRLRALLEQDPAKADHFADALIHQEVTADLRTHLADSHAALERERIETKRLRDRIDIVTEDRQQAVLERQLAVSDKETAWQQNDTLLQNLKSNFGTDDFDHAVWTRCDALAKEKEGLEGTVAGYEHERRETREEAVALRARIAQSELDLAISRGCLDGGEEGISALEQELRNQLLVLQVENDVLKAELEFQIAERANREQLETRLERGVGDVREGA